MVADALSRMLEVENLSFTVLKNDLLETIKGKCEHDPHYTKVWQMVLKRDPSPPRKVHKHTMLLPHRKTLTRIVMSFIVGNIFLLMMATYFEWVE